MDVLQAPSSEARAATRRLRIRLAIGVGVVLLAGAVWWLVQLLDKPKAARKPSAQQIALVRPNTPPPPPPKPPEKQPEPPKPQDEVKMDTPKPPDAPKSDEPPPAAKLGVDATGSGEGDGFGLAANKGGRDITAAPTVGGGGGGGAPSRLAYAFYRDVVTRHINDELNRIDKLKGTDGQLAVLVWVDRAGRIERVELRDASDEQTRLIRERLLASRAMREPPPDTMPQPIWVLLNLRELG